MRFILSFLNSAAFKCILTLGIALFSSSALYPQSFSKAPSLAGIGFIDNRTVVAEDIDNNSWPDLVFTTRGSGGNYIKYNYRGNYQSAPSTNSIVNNTSNTAMATVGDINNDCILDFYMSVGGGGVGSGRNANVMFEANSITSYSIVPNSGATTRTRTTSGALWVDLDEDGDLDLYVYNSSNQKNEYYENRGNLLFVEVDTLGITNATETTQHVSFCDYDGDGDLDNFQANNGSKNLLLRNDDTTFHKITSGHIVNDIGSSFSSIWGDYDGDGDFDLYVSQSSFDKNHLYRNDTNGFTRITSGSAVTGNDKTLISAWIDFDNDGDLDLLNVNNGVNDLYKNDGSGNFTSVSAGSLTSDNEKSTSVGIADLNRDGYEDVVVSTRNGKPKIYMNTDTGNNYLNVNLLGVQGKSSANYAEVKAKADVDGTGAKWMHRLVNSSIGKNSQSTHKAHFGLGSATTVDSLVIKWVTGKTCTFTNLAVNGFFNVKPGGCTMDTVLHSEFEDSTSALNVFFTNKSSSSATSYHWDFGDGDASNQKNPQHRYSTPGTYTVSLTTEDNYCKWDSVVKVISVCGDSANPGFTVAYNNLQLNFSDTTNSIVGHSTSWDFGDGITGTGKNVQHVYQSTGTYQVCLTVDDSCHTYTVCDSIQVCDSLQTGFGYSLVGKKITLTDSSNGTTVKYLLGDGSSANRANISYNYAQGGYYDVCQIVSNACVTDTLCKRIGVCVDTAVSAFSHSATNKQVSFSSNNSQNAKQYFWDFGDGNTSTQANPTHLYQSFQTYNVCLIVSNNCFSDTTCKTIDICPFAPGVAGFNYSLLGIPNGVKFNQQAQNAISYQWDFGDGGSSTNPNPSHVFPRKDTFNVCLTITDSCNNQDTDCQIVDLVNVS